MNAKLETLKHEVEAVIAGRGTDLDNVNRGIIVKIKRLAGSLTTIFSLDVDDTLTDSDWPYRIDLIRSIPPFSNKPVPGDQDYPQA